MQLILIGSGKDIAFEFGFLTVIDDCLIMESTDEQGGSYHHPLRIVNNIISYGDIESTCWFVATTHEYTRPHHNLVIYDKELSHGAWEYFQDIREKNNLFNNLESEQKYYAGRVALGLRVDY